MPRPTSILPPTQPGVSAANAGSMNYGSMNVGAMGLASREYGAMQSSAARHDAAGYGAANTASARNPYATYTNYGAFGSGYGMSGAMSRATYGPRAW